MSRIHLYTPMYGRTRYVCIPVCVIAAVEANYGVGVCTCDQVPGSNRIGLRAMPSRALAPRPVLLPALPRRRSCGGRAAAGCVYTYVYWVCVRARFPAPGCCSQCSLWPFWHRLGPASRLWSAATATAAAAAQQTQLATTRRSCHAPRNAVQDGATQSLRP